MCKATDPTTPSGTSISRGGDTPTEGIRPGRLTIIVPYRQRLKHLQAFIPHMERFLSPRVVSFRILVIHQCDSLPFNRGAVLNIGFLLAESPETYVCFHDVDLLPQDEACDYRLPLVPTHLAGRAEQYDLQLPYPTYFGGVTIFPPFSFRQINGFSNMYWGWGREDDDLYLRLASNGLSLSRKQGHYQSLPHPRTSRSRLASNTGYLKAHLKQVYKHEKMRCEDMSHLRDFCDIQPLAAVNLIDPNRDGLSSIRYKLMNRLPLSETKLFPQAIESRHEIISVSLPGDLLP